MSANISRKSASGKRAQSATRPDEPAPPKFVLPEVAREIQERESNRASRVRRWILLNSFAVSLGLSVWAHSLLPLIGFVLPQSGVKKHQDQGLQVVLVNARHQKAPRDAQALAQANLDGGGEQADQKHMPTSPLPPQNAVRDGDALVEAKQRQRQLEAKQRELLAMVQGGKTQVASERARQSAEAPTETAPVERGLDLSNASAIARQEAVVEKQLRDYASRPRRGFISPRTQEHKLAMYGEAFRLKLERVGELNFPRGSKGALYGSVMVVVEIRPDGSLESAEIHRPSPDPKINEAALRIVRLAAPYARIPDELRKDYDILVLPRTMNFTREDVSVQQ